MNKKVAVLGANGQIGSLFTERLSHVDGIHPVAICRNAAGAGLLRLVNCEVRLGSMTSPTFNKSLLGDCDVLINCIWPSGSAQAIDSQNAVLLGNVAQLQRISHFISLSSVAVYGSCIDANWSTYARPRPDSAYGETKMEAERRIAKIYGDSTKRYHIIRLGHVYGDEQWLSRYILENAADNRFRLPYDGNRSSNAIHVDDVTRALVGLIRDPCASGIYNLTPTPQQSWRDLFDWHTDACGLTRVHSMEEGQAKSLHNTFVLESRNSPLKKGLVVFGNLKQGFSLEWLLGSNDFKHLGNVVLSFLPARIERRMKAISAMRIVRNEIAMLRTPSPSGSFLFSDAMPGPYLDIPTSLVGHDVEAAERRRRLLEYYRTCILGSGW